jgi:putative PIN family toxin of toxin-antitoxin system
MWRKARHKCQFAGSQQILHEVEEKLRIKFGFSPRHARVMTLFAKRQIELVRVVSVITICRDPDDNPILAAALDASCSHLVTGDLDLLTLKSFGNLGSSEKFLSGLSWVIE